MTGQGKLKRNSKATLDIYLQQRKKNMTEAYLQTHPNASRETAQVRGSELLNSPAGIIYTEQQENKAKLTITALMDSEKDDIKLRAAQDILDRNTGKARQLDTPSSTGLTLMLDLSGSTVNVAMIENKNQQ